VLIEGAWTYRMQARVSRKPLDRIERLPQAIRDIAWRAQLRLCHRYRRLAAAGKPKVVVTIAIAREIGRLHLGDRPDRPATTGDRITGPPTEGDRSASAQLHPEAPGGRRAGWGFLGV